MTCSVVAPSSVPAQVISDQQRSTAQIRQSRKASRLIENAISKRENGNLEAFIDKLQEAREDFKNWLVPVTSANGLFKGVRHRTDELLFSLDEKGRTVYQKKFEEQARLAFQEAKKTNNPAKLYNVADRYPLTETALDALERLGGRRFKEGTFKRALRVYERMYRILQDVHKKTYAAQKIAFCLARLGRVNSLKEFKRQLPEVQLQQSVHAGETEQTLLTFVEQQMNRARRRRRISNQTGSNKANWSPDEWIPASPEVQLQNGPSNQLNPKIIFSIPDGASRQFRHNRIRRTRNGLQEIRSFYPMIVDNHILLNNGVSCWAWNLPADSHPPTKNPSWSLSGNGIDGSQVMKDVRLLFRGSGSPDGNYFCSLVTDLGKSEKQMIKLQVRFPIPWRALFSIDVSGGEVNWKRGGPSDRGFARNASFPSGAVHEDGTLYATAVKFQTSKDTPNLYGSAIDASSGKVLWNTFLTKNMLGTNLFENTIREVVPDVPVVGEKNVYLNTNTGVVAALDRETGNLQWLYRYMQWRFPNTESIYPKRQSTYWQNNLPLLMNDTLLFTPTDSLRLIAIDRNTGKVKWKHEQPRLHTKLKGFARWLVPMSGNRYVLSSKNGVMIYSASSGKQISRPFISPVPIEGRPTVLENHIALPTQKGIDLIRYETNQKQNKIELSKEGTLTSRNFYNPGNVFFHNNHILMAGPEQFSFFRLISN